MKEIEYKVYALIGKNGKIKAAEMLGMSFNTLARRLYKGDWRLNEVELIKKTLI